MAMNVFEEAVEFCERKGACSIYAIMLSEIVINMCTPYCTAQEVIFRAQLLTDDHPLVDLAGVSIACENNEEFKSLFSRLINIVVTGLPSGIEMHELYRQKQQALKAFSKLYPHKFAELSMK